jgi:hypothetical protein
LGDENLPQDGENFPQEFLKENFSGEGKHLDPKFFQMPLIFKLIYWETYKVNSIKQRET